MKRTFSEYFIKLRHAFSTPVRTFLIIASISGLLLIFLMPPLTGADEEAHFVRAYGISNGDIVLNGTNEVEMPRSYRQTIGCFQYKEPIAGKTYTYKYDEYGDNKKAALTCAIQLPLDADNTEMVRTSAGPYAPLTYIPQVVSIMLGKFFDMPVVAMVYLVRIMTLATYIGLIVLALRIIPVRKWALAGVALLPHSIIHITNPGGDYILYGFVAVLIAVVVNSILASKRVLRKQNKLFLSFLVLSAVMLVLPKGPFPGVLFLPLILFYGGMRFEILKKGLIVAGALIIALLWYKLGMSVVQPWREAVLSTSLWDFPYAFIKTMFFGWVETDFVQVGNIIRTGFYVGIPSIVVTVINVLLAIYILVGYPEDKVIDSAKKRQIRILAIFSVCIALAVIIGSFAALYIGVPYSQKEDMIIRGVQTRYFYPAFMLLAALPSAHLTQVTNMNTYAKIVIIGSTIALAALITVVAFAFLWIEM